MLESDLKVWTVWNIRLRECDPETLRKHLQDVIQSK